MRQRMIPPSEMGHQYSAAEVAEAIRNFKENGGLIKKLPEQRVQVNRMVLPKGYFPAYEGVGLNGNGIEVSVAEEY